MDCKTTAELLPWLLNGTLEGAQEEEVRSHLDRCPQCRSELQEAKEAWEIYDQHPPTELLLDYASGTASDDSVRTIREHLENCPSCAEQLSLARESLRRIEDPGEVDSQAADGFRVPHWQAAVAAGVILLLASGWLWSWQSGGDSEKISELLAANERLRRSETELRDREIEGARFLRGEVERLLAPQLNTLAVDVFPQEMVLRSGSGLSNKIAIPAEASSVTLILNSPRRSAYPSYAIELRDPDGNPVWNGEGLVRNPTGDYTISMSAAFLKTGVYTAVVFGIEDGKRLKTDSYRIEIEKREE